MILCRICSSMSFAEVAKTSLSRLKIFSCYFPTNIILFSFRPTQHWKSLVCEFPAKVVSVDAFSVKESYLQVSYWFLPKKASPLFYSTEKSQQNVDTWNLALVQARCAVICPDLDWSVWLPLCLTAYFTPVLPSLYLIHFFPVTVITSLMFLCT